MSTARRALCTRALSQGKRRVRLVDVSLDSYGCTTRALSMALSNGSIRLHARPVQSVRIVRRLALRLRLSRYFQVIGASAHCRKWFVSVREVRPAWVGPHWRRSALALAGAIRAHVPIPLPAARWRWTYVPMATMVPCAARAVQVSTARARASARLATKRTSSPELCYSSSPSSAQC